MVDDKADSGGDCGLTAQPWDTELIESQTRTTPEAQELRLSLSSDPHVIPKAFKVTLDVG